MWDADTKSGQFLNQFGYNGNQFRFIRHAATAWNEKKLCQGLRDIPLTPKSLEESVQLGERLRTLSIECICSSPLLRALETARAIHHHHPEAQLHIIDDLKERDWGTLEGISSEAMYRIEEQEERDPHFNPGHDIEPRLNFQMRIVKGVNKALTLHPCPLLVSHGRLFLSLCEILHLPLLRQIPNLAIIEFTKTAGTWQHQILPL